MSADFLVELGTEELPPKSLLRLRDAFADGIVAGLAEARLEHGAVQSYATPRRLAVLVKALPLEQPTQKIENRGPPVRLAYDDAGAPTKAATAFATKCGVAVSELTTVSTDKGEWLYYSGTRAGAATRDLLGPVVSTALAGLPIPKRMRWGAGDAEFVRPAHWLVMLHGDTVVPASILGLAAGRSTRGHRFHHPDELNIDAPADYAELLETQGHVVADFARRQARVVEVATAAAAELGGRARLEPDVVEEVTALVEWPVPVAGRFAEAFLQLPPEVLISTLQDHQRYFPVENDAGLLPAFIATSNLESRQPDEVRRGNERVVLPRLADAQFFWQQDTQQTLASRVPMLASVVYQQGLGSLHDKSQRVAALAQQLAPAVGAAAAEVARAAELARTDLLTDMVGEFPELQGRMGYYYALHDQEAASVAHALEEQYLPRHAGDRLPEHPVGIALALADRLDTLAGIFMLGKKPTGNKDPFGLRRQALGLVRIIVERALDCELPTLLAQATELQPAPTGKKAVSAAAATDELVEFVTDRMRSWYLDGLAPGLERGAITAELFAAVAVTQPAAPLDFHARLQAVQRFAQHAAASSLAAANKRIANILRKNAADASAALDPALFQEAAERDLHAAVASLLEDHANDLGARRYEAALTRLAGLREPVDAYFDQVMVNADDPSLRDNRLAQLGQLNELFTSVADISQLSVS